MRDLLVALTVSVLPLQGQAFDHPGLLHTQEQIDETVTQALAEQAPWKAAYDDLLSRAAGDEGLGRAPHAVADFHVPGFYVDPEGHRAASEPLIRDGWAAYACALAFRLRGDPTFADKAVELLNAWAYTNTQYSGDDGVLVMSYAGTSLLFAADLLWTSDRWDSSDRAQFGLWVTNVLRAAGSSIQGRPNNWGDWGTLAVIGSDYLLDNEQAIDMDIDRLRGRIDSTIAADGHLPEETARGDHGIWYTYFALAPRTAACQVAWNARGVDLFNYGRLKLALDYLFYYSLYPEQWPYGPQSLLPTPDDWPGNLFEAMVRIYGQPEYEAWIDASRPHVVKWHHYAWTVPTLMRPLALKALGSPVLEIMSRVADWQIAHLSGYARTWVEATFYAGLMATYRTTGEPRFLNQATSWAQANNWIVGPGPRNADDQCAGQSYLELYQIEPGPERLASTQSTLDNMIANPRLGREDWWWCDALFMAPPVFARLGAITGDRNYFDFMSTMWWDTTDFLFDMDENLFFRDASYFQRLCPNGQKMFWSRGNGWVMAGIVRVLQYLPADHPDRDRFVALLQNMAQRLAGLQKGDGFWPSCLTDADDFPWPETSGTSAFCYALAWGINEGVLDRNQYLPVVQNAWTALVSAVDTDGKLGWVQPSAAEPGMSRQSDSFPFGVGLFLLAASEVYRVGL